MEFRSKTKGQVSIFLVFLFQVLFVFFAMIVNVGMLVYYKINLQNSVDLAAYYAAMKQSEMLNTIAHVNYQIRQSWKLLSYRTLILGTLGPDSHPGHRIPPNSFGPAPNEIPYADASGKLKMPVFCMTIAEIFANVIGVDGNAVNNKSDNQCRDDVDHNLSGFKIPDVIWSLPGYNEVIRDGAIALQDKFLSEFSAGGIRNFNTLASFIIMFRADSMNRRKVISVLANSMSKDTNDFFDIDGQSVAAGARKVLTKNLADQNNVGLSMDLYNSLANQNCGGANPNTEELPGWLKEIELNVMYAYMDSITNDEVFDGPGKAQQGIRFMGFDASSIPITIQKLGSGSDRFQTFLKFSQLTGQSGYPNHPAGRWTTAVGVEKNPWCMPYIGFKAQATPRLPFMPLRGSLKLEAKTFAKPFGSRIGPWYGRSWPNRSPGSTSDTNPQLLTDTKLPPRIYDGGTTSPPNGPNDYIRLFPGYSRFVGDRLGFMSQQMRWAYGKYYWRADHGDLAYWTTMWKGPVIEAFSYNQSPSSPFYMGPFSGDILADGYNATLFTGNTAEALKYAKEMRRSELAAIAPDIFDITYYTIEPRFEQYILPRLNNFVHNFNTKRPDLMVRGDLGWRAPGFNGEPAIAGPDANVEIQTGIFGSHVFNLNSQGKIFHTIANPTQILTSWAETSIIDYDPNQTTNKIGRCIERVPAGAEPWTPGACNKGGRTGYSIKVVSKKYLENEIPDIGGQGVSGTILNPPDPNF